MTAAAPMHGTSGEDQKTLWSLTKDIKLGMLTHRHGRGMSRRVPLTTQNGKDDQADVLYFFYFTPKRHCQRGGSKRQCQRVLGRLGLGALHVSVQQRGYC